VITEPISIEIGRQSLATLNAPTIPYGARCNHPPIAISKSLAHLSFLGPVEEPNDLTRFHWAQLETGSCPNVSI
jgi:hypothetical protein